MSKTALHDVMIGVLFGIIYVSYAYVRTNVPCVCIGACRQVLGMFTHHVVLENTLTSYVLLLLPTYFSIN